MNLKRLTQCTSVMLVTVWLLTIQVACGLKPIDLRYEVDPILESYVKVFELVAAAHGKPIKIDVLVAEFVEDIVNKDKNSITLGQCTSNSSGRRSPRIQISKKFWYDKGTTEWDKRYTMFHELGHCILKLKHNDRKLNNIPYSIMNAINIGHIYNEYTYAMYDQRLFE